LAAGDFAAAAIERGGRFGATIGVGRMAGYPSEGSCHSAHILYRRILRRNDPDAAPAAEITVIFVPEYQPWNKHYWF
jgi:hypothetical protein